MGKILSFIFREEASMGKIYDGIIGVAIGDALGVPVEFIDRKEIAKSPITTMIGYKTHMQPPGTWSDDTSLTLALLDSITQKHGIDYKDIMDKFSEWMLYNEYTATGKIFDIGNATSRAIMNYGRGQEPLMCGGITKYENGNGSLMRILPIAFYFDAQPNLSINSRIELVHNLSSLTHRHPISLIGCGIYICIALKLLSEKVSLIDSIKLGIDQAFSYYNQLKWNDIAEYNRLKDITEFANLSHNQIKSTGYVVHTLEAALWCLLNSDSYKTCVLKAVNLGDDTDTTAAVAGGLAGIYYGAENIPKEWLTTLLKRDYIENLCILFENTFS